MRQESGTPKEPPEKMVRDIRRVTLTPWSPRPDRPSTFWTYWANNLDLGILSRRGEYGAFWTMLYKDRVRNVLVFDSVPPLHAYTGHTPGPGHSLINPTKIHNFLTHHEIKTDRIACFEILRRETFRDMQEFDICLPRTAP